MEMTPPRSSTPSVIGAALPHESAALHVSGRAAYVDDLPELAGTLHAALGLSPVAHGRLVEIDVEALQREPGVVAVLTAADIPGRNDCGPIVHDDPILAEDELRHLGQPVFAIVATSRGEGKAGPANRRTAASVVGARGPCQGRLRRAAHAPDAQRIG
jgi:xanthine dehydrogenase large subunit